MPDDRVGGHRLLLFRGADLDLPLERAAAEDRRHQVRTEAPHRVVAILQHEEIAGNRVDARRQRDRRQPRRLGLADAMEGRGDPALGGDDVGAALQQFRRQPGRDGGRLPGQLRAHAGGRRGVPAEQQLQGADGLRPRQFDLPQGIAVHAGVRARDVDVLVVADADARSGFRDADQLLAALQGPARRLGLQPRFHGHEPVPCRPPPPATAARTRSPPPRTRRRRPPPRGRTGRAPRHRSPSSARARRPAGRSCRRTSCRRRARADRPTATASRRRASRRGWRSRRASRRCRDRRCARSPPARPPSARHR